MVSDRETMRLGQAQPRRLRRRSRGFTLIELMIVITIILILIGMAVGNYQKSVLRARETALLQDLHVMREAIDNFTTDKQTAPQSLEDLVQNHYIREIPTDPMTQKKDWVAVYDDVVLTPDQASSGVTDVHSASDATSTRGDAYSSW